MMKGSSSSAALALAACLLPAACARGPASADAVARQDSSILGPRSALALLTAEDVRSAIAIAEFEQVTPEEAEAARRVMAARRATLGRTWFPVSRYQSFPIDARNLLRRAEIEQQLCRGPGNEETMNVCNRAHKFHVQLGRLGWCWGGSDVSAGAHWVRCEDDPYTAPGQLEGTPPPFPEA